MLQETELLGTIEQTVGASKNLLSHEVRREKYPTECTQGAEADESL